VVATSTAPPHSLDVTNWSARLLATHLEISDHHALIAGQAIRRGTLTSDTDLIAAIEAASDGSNDSCQPFVWTKFVGQIFPQASCRGLQTRDTGENHALD
jgi:hypothetical protein